MASRMTSNAIRQSASDIIQSQTCSSQFISGEVRSLSRNVENQLTLTRAAINEQTTTIERQTASINSQTAKINCKLTDIQHEISIGFGNLLHTAEFMSERFDEYMQQMIEILKAPNKTQAKENFEDGVKFYNKGTTRITEEHWYDNAIKHLEKSTEQYDDNSMAHLLLGHIYHYSHKRRDLELALIHYSKALSYEDANDDYDKAIIINASYYAAWLNAVVTNDYEKSIELAEEGIGWIELANPRILRNDSYYNLLLYYGISEQFEKYDYMLGYYLGDDEALARELLGNGRILTAVGKEIALEVIERYERGPMPELPIPNAPK